MTSSDDAFERDLAATLVADSPPARPDFKEELRERVDQGFPRERRLSLPSFSLPSRRKLLPALAVATCAVVAVSVVGLRGDDETAQLSGGGRSLPDSTAMEQAPGAAAPQRAVPPATDQGPEQEFAPGRQQRIERSARLTLQVPDNRLERTGRRIVATTERHRGYVLSSSRQDGQDVTAGYVSASDRLQSARAARRSLLRRLERADNDTQAEALRRQLDLNAQQVSGLRNQLRALRVRTDYASVSVTLTSREDDDGAAAPADGMGKALDDALGSLSDSAELAVRALGVAIPVGVLALLAWLTARTIRRRRRDAVLG